MYYLNTRQKVVLTLQNDMEHKNNCYICPKGITALFLSTSFIIGSVIGFFVAEVTEKPINDVPIESSVIKVAPQRIDAPMEAIAAISETTITVSERAVVEPSEPTNIYYDCPLSYDLQDHIRNLCEINDLPMTLVIAIIELESSFRENVISRTNDYGLMQINKINHEWLSKEYGITDFLDPYQNVFCGITILSQHYIRFQDVDKALMAYNLGATGAKRLWNKGTYETSYTRRIKTTMEVYENEIKQISR